MALQPTDSGLSQPISWFETSCPKLTNAETSDPKPTAVTAALRQIDAIDALVATHPADLALCTTAADVRAAHVAKKIAILIGIEGGHMINNDLGVLDDFARRGARYLTLTHMVNTDWADSSGDKPAHNGLTDFGRQVVRELNRLGVMVDVSHVSDKTFWDVMAVSQSPVIASHSSCRALCGHPRNMTDEMIKALAAKGGTIHAFGHSSGALLWKQTVAGAGAVCAIGYPGNVQQADE